MKAILLPVADRPECKLALDTAFLLAKQFEGSVIGCHLRPHRGEAQTDKSSELNSQAAQKLFRRLATDNEFRLTKQPTLGAKQIAQWIEMVGSLDKLFSIVGPTADASIVSRPKRTSKGRAADFVLSAMLGTGKPVIVLPQAPITSLGNRVLIAWNQSVDSARAVSAALPILQQAEAVEIVTVGSESRTGPKASALTNYLKLWGVKSSRTRCRGRDPAAEILETYRSTNSDLIVMGAYSRGRFRERIFGGVTEDLVFRSGEPVFALHN
jgi:nucleotide-binding universal stress UspA family protein